MTNNNVNLNSVSGAIIPYTPPKSAEEFVNGEVVKKAHEIFEKAIHVHLQECKLLKVPQELFLKWKHLANSGLLPNEDFLSILRDEEVLPNLFYFLDSNSFLNLSRCSKDMNEDVDQYSEQIFEYYFGKSSWELTLDDLELESFENRLLNKAIENHAPGIAIEKFFFILFQNKRIGNVEFEEILYTALHKAINCHAPEDTILSLLEVGEIKNIKVSWIVPWNFIELTLKEKVATKEIIEALLKAGCELDSAPDSTLFNALQYGASAEVIKTLLQEEAIVVGKGNEPGGVTINDAIDYHASKEVIQLLLDKGAKVDVGRTRPDDNPSSIYRALQNGEASIEIIQILLNAGAKVTGMTVYFAGMMGVSREVYHLLEETRADKKRARRELESSYC